MQNHTFGDILIEARKRKKISQTELAKKVFVTRQAISRWENNYCFPDETALPLLCKELEIDENLVNIFKNNTDKIEEINLAIKKEKKKIYTKCGVLLGIVIFFLVLLIIFLITNYKCFVVYKGFIENDSFQINNLILIKSKEKNYLGIGSITSNIFKTDKDKIIKIKLFSLKDEKEKLIMETQYERNISIEEQYGYNEYFNDIDEPLEEIFIEITSIIDGKKIILTYPLVLEKIIEQNLDFHSKEKQIGPDNSEDKVAEEVKISEEKLLENGYTYNTNYDVYEKKDELSEFSYSTNNKTLFYGKIEKNISLSVKYYFKFNDIFINVFDYDKNRYTMVLNYNLDDEKLDCLVEPCNNYEQYVDFIMKEIQTLT